MSERDPRISPIHGDIVRVPTGDMRERHCLGVQYNDWVGYFAVRKTSTVECHCSLRAWQIWCAHHAVEIVQRAEDLYGTRT